MPLGKRFGDDEESRFCGVEITFARDLQATLHESLIGGFDYILLPLAHPRNERRAKESLPEGSPLPPPFARSDLLLSSSQWSSQVVGVLSPWIDLDSDCPHVRRDGESALKQELAWATHLSLQACVAPTPRGLDMVNYARHVSNFLMSGVSMQVWLRIPLVSGEMLRAEGTDAEDEVFLTRHPIIRRPMYADPWEWWNMFRSICEHNSLLGVALDIPASLPAKSSWLRWLGEPVKVAILPTSVFLTNRKGYPTLSKAHQELITTLFDHKVQVVIRGKSFHDKPVPDTLRGKSLTAEQTDVLQELQATGSAGPARHPLRPYLEYVSYLYRRAPPPTDQDIFEVGYRDYLQAPLQPLMDHLESQTYETFEKDWTKYAVYQQAVYRALMDRVAAGVAGGSGGGSTVLMVVGAGRGPLVRASLRAAADAGASIRVYAVEKNPNAVITLQSLAEHEGWGDAVTIVSGDMRLWEAPEKADILVSELLGSFGDNELSPECLDGAQRFLKEGGISIPCKYTRWVADASTHGGWRMQQTHQLLCLSMVVDRVWTMQVN
eukprot:jgi/Mesvir1/15985/Mv08291-RA.3